MTVEDVAREAAPLLAALLAQLDESEQAEREDDAA